ncbi:MAG: S9 family peptidase [Saprospiraceae bacterium]
MPFRFIALVCLLVFGFGESSILLAQPAALPAPPPAAKVTEITLDEIWSEFKFFAKRVPGFNFRQQGNSYTRIKDNKVEDVDFTSGEAVAVLFDYEVVKTATGDESLPKKFDSYSFSEDQKRMLIKTGTEKIFRRSSRANFYLLDNGTLKPIDPAGKQMYASFSPDGNKVAYVRDNDMYVYDVPTGSRKRITSDGEVNAIINGATDWVYEEEFALAKGFEWSPDSKSLLFLRFDERAVPEFTMQMYNDDLYPENRTWKYPKVGEDNATVSAHVYDVASAKTRLVFDTKDGNTHIPRIYYTPDSKPLVWVTNRHQDTFQLLVERVPMAKLTKLLVETSSSYLEVKDDLTFLDDGSFLWTSERSGYNHLYHFDKQGKLIRQLTKGNYPVTSFYGYDAAAKKLYFQAAMKSPMQREVYALPLKGGKPKAIAATPGTNSAVFNGDYSGYMISHSSINTPPTYAVFNGKGKLVRSLEDNAKLSGMMNEEGVRPVEFFDFGNGQGTRLNGWRITPEGFSESAGVEYPLFMFQYSGPGSQQVLDSWRGTNYWWFQMLVQQGYVVACVDGRGTGARGEAFEKQTYLQLGKYEVEDQIAAAKHLGSQSWIDAERIGIFGWSYGGFMSTLCILKGADVFKLAIAVAPVTSWKWYDTLYTERYMRTLTENEAGYKENSPVYFADKLEGHYMLVHGMGDDNVHYQHSVEMANALIKENKDFEFYTYPNRNHGIYGGVTRLHLYERMTEFINERL